VLVLREDSARGSQFSLAKCSKLRELTLLVRVPKADDSTCGHRAQV
jgi:hypothetical protein